MALAWSRFAEEVARRKPLFWVRDDDAVALTPALRRLLSLAKESNVPLALAVIPDLAEPDLFTRMGEGVSVLQHGCDHRNRAAPGEKKTEFPAQEGIPQALDRLRLAHQRLVSMGGSKVLPVVAPPWNRMRRELAAALPRIGIEGLSGYGKEEAIPGVRQINTHVDIVAWRDGKRFVGDDEAVRLAMTYVLNDQPVGWLTHHAVHDADAWSFLARLFALRGPRWARAAELFSYTRPAHG
jgi:peptidoglycan/xylan/chitin deacetylase (PgdA/CDA1 family)